MACFEKTCLSGIKSQYDVCYDGTFPRGKLENQSYKVSGSECRGIEKNRKEEKMEILFFRGRLITHLGVIYKGRCCTLSEFWLL